MNKRSGEPRGVIFDERQSIRQANLNRNLNKEDSTSLPSSVHSHRLGDVLGCPDLAQLDITWVLAQGLSQVSRMQLRGHKRPDLNRVRSCLLPPLGPPLGCQIQGCAHVARVQPHLSASLQAAAGNWRQQRTWRRGQPCC